MRLTIFICRAKKNCFYSFVNSNNNNNNNNNNDNDNDNNKNDNNNNTIKKNPVMHVS